MEEIITAAFLSVLVISGVPLVVIAFSAGVASLLAACFQIQEASIVHLVRLAAITVVLVLLGNTAFSEVETLFSHAVQLLKQSGGS